MIRHIFCDLDGTLYNNGISDEDIKAIEEIEKEGVIFHVATGRVFKQAYKMLSDKTQLNGYFICENGSFIFDKDKNLIFKEPIDDYLVRKIINRFESDLAHLYLKYNGDIILSGGEEAFSNYTKDYILDKEMFKKENFDNLVGNVGIVSNNMDELKRLEYYYKSEFSDVCDIYLSGPYTLNIVPNHVSKRHGIEHICKKYNINLDEVATMGDSPNDICMLKDIKHSFAMDKSNKDVKESASYVVSSVREAIEKIKKINRTK
ncbi:MAG: HAD family hydrolase [Terrisporobacter othiniensis]|uniref:HAD family hydrolase n=1 Tax=Terrisporobacter petrolearius TaxID=1460447 RepID=UPI002906398B|nr:HAD family hydrolase [Terrisporobacter othiniensis]MDU6995166.1 HAD family hydrolase [Terrisporobacter othiniensis]